MGLNQKHCVPCEGGVAPLKKGEIDSLFKELKPGWKVVDNKLEKEYKFDDFLQALSFTNLIGKVAENENHHPDIELGWGRVKLILWTHAVNGLTENDFILAAKADDELSHQSPACF
jgi:4a-hydroxytetrahydrobiopterin dehydratase